MTTPARAQGRTEALVRSVRLAGKIRLSFPDRALKNRFLVITLEGKPHACVNSPLGFVWWYAADRGGRPVSWRSAARAFARQFGIAIVLQGDATVIVFDHRAGLTFEIAGGRMLDEFW